ncbi:MAG: hypothetical protein JWR44_961 [Hymenobacter sp.]|jgi:hypothetical protein|nr:hypothetical protein [Hymenobacter sp.]
MKTLQKITLVAFALLSSAGVASAQQCVNCTPPTITPPSTRPDPGCRNCVTNPNSATGRYASQSARPASPNSSLSADQSAVFQQGVGQYACVEQIGFDNTADLVQDAGSATGIGNNDAYQTQISLVSTVDNVLYGLQTGSNNLMVQHQNGYDNLARSRQTGNGNLSAQDQGGTSSADHGNSAYVLQTSSNNAAIQYQRGVDNTADTYQHNINGNWSATNQNGTGNVVVVNQH